MPTDLTFMESHRSKIKQPSKYGALSHHMFFLALFPWGNPALGKVRERKEPSDCRSSL